MQKDVRSELIGRVRARRAELEQTILTRIQETTLSVAGEADAGYLAGLHAAVGAAIDHGLSALEHGQERIGPTPAKALLQARRAARAGVSVDTVLRRYVLGSNVVSDFLMQETDRVDFPDKGTLLREMLGEQASVLDRLMTAITNEYTDELERAQRSPEQGRIERVRKLLAGQCSDTAELGYELGDWHLGAIASGDGAVQALKRIAEGLGTALLWVPWGEDAAWGWLGRPHALAAVEAARAVGEQEETGKLLVALGEPGQGYEGWRITHLQAQAALSVALRTPRPVTRYADVALVASVLRDDALARSLVEIYLSPLGDRQNGGAALRETLRAYFAAERNASSAASALGVARHTVERRLRSIEERLGQRLRTRQAELEVALRLEELGDRPNVQDAPDAT
jgi:hypothetical protein